MNLDDPLVREMADRNHQPEEVWTIGGELRAVRCEQCGQEWPCETRRALRAKRDEVREEFAEMRAKMRGAS